MNGVFEGVLLFGRRHSKLPSSRTERAAMIFKNKLLSKIPQQELEALIPNFDRVQLPLKMVLHEQLEPIEHVYFVERGVVSMVNEPEDGDIVEFATIGPEGMAGFPVLLNTPSVPNRAMVQIPGEALRMRVRDFQRALPHSPVLNRLLLRYLMALLNQVAQGASCNRLHEVSARCARWLLQTHDRVEGDTFPLTQEFLAQMLGVHRPSVSVAAAALQTGGLIQYGRGSITITDRKGLEAASCNCYELIKGEYDRLLQSD
ncbi:Crp/Fnr family transcriptional regulator [Mesorhizobium sp. BR1-1-16]|uniref:Crp/Fnr family transcriptional regulator n=1 Tax=Mesorhizobium sp. BR1-1-16 TaxID=2876653 RepID=UPI001CC9498E|nr:Crp/Fnr family transcriptional regulator [Mesorhizobium sp. BR1-1-16]MBZ9936946.1 Crp/Fnr family transcriptional regulator [Mesorhizobium sp. BR1-1-16]